MRSIFLLMSLFSFLFVSTAMAESQIGYDYIDVAYQWTKYDADQLKDSNGLDTKLSVELIEHLVLEGGYNFQDSELGGRNLDANQYEYGLLGYYDLCPETHLLIRTGGIVQTIDTFQGNNSEDGVYAGAGVRYLLTDDIELDGDITYSWIENRGNDWFYEGTGLFGITEQLDIKTAVGLTDDVDVVLTGGLRLNF